MRSTPKTSTATNIANLGVRIVNLDPTNDPDKVCEAYRQIKIADQNRRIQKNREYLAKQRRLKDQKEMAALIKKQEAEAKKKARPIANRVSSATSKRQKAIKDLLLAGKVISKITDQPSDGSAASKNTIGTSNAILCKDIMALRNSELDIVSINGGGSHYLKGNEGFSLWCIDNLPRSVGTFTSRPLSAHALVKELILKELLAGNVIDYSDINATRSTVYSVIGNLRKEGFAICIVKNSRTDEKPRGWVLPSTKNGLVSE